MQLERKLSFKSSRMLLFGDYWGEGGKQAVSTLTLVADAN
jgi:hypothetical protein